MNLARLAARNLRRHRSRTLATAAAIAVGVAALVFARGWVDGVSYAIREHATDSRLGAIQIHPAGYASATSLLPVDLHLSGTAALLDTVRRTPGVAAATERIHFAGSLSDGDRDTLVLATAIDPEGEARVCPAFLAADLRAGRLLTPADTTSVVIGAELAAAMRLGPGSQVTIEARTASGQLNAIDVDVVGVASSSLPDEGKWLVVLPLATARRMVGLPDEHSATALVVRLHDLDRAGELAQVLQGALGGAVEVRSWREVGAYFAQALRMFDRAQAILLVVIGLLAILVVANTQMLSASERTKEIGTLMALGAPRRLVRRMFVAEALMVGALASIAGAALGALACVVAGRIGIPFKPPNQPIVLVRPVATLGTAALGAGVALAVAIAGSVLPAWLAARKHPLEAIRR